MSKYRIFNRKREREQEINHALAKDMHSIAGDFWRVLHALAQEIPDEPIIVVKANDAKESST